MSNYIGGPKGSILFSETQDFPNANSALSGEAFRSKSKRASDSIHADWNGNFGKQYQSREKNVLIWGGLQRSYIFLVFRKL